jgi:ketosteroid isomerase-like protein
MSDDQCPRCSAERRATTLTRAIVASIGGDVSQVENLFTPDVIGSSPASRATSREELAIEIEERRDVFAGLEVDSDPLSVCGARACVEWVATAVQYRPLVLERSGRIIEPTEHRLSMRAVTVADFRGDRISAFRSYWDEGSMFDSVQ